MADGSGFKRGQDVGVASIIGQAGAGRLPGSKNTRGGQVWGMPAL